MPIFKYKEKTYPKYTLPNLLITQVRHLLKQQNNSDKMDDQYKYMRPKIGISFEVAFGVIYIGVIT